MAVIPVGQEPERIKRRLDALLSKLDEAYPDKVIRSLEKDHKHWAETITELYRLLGYESRSSFLEAYGYKVEKEASSGRRPNDHMAIIEELKRRYPNGPELKKTAELQKANPDLAPKIKTIANNAKNLFGMPIAEYLISIGLLMASEENFTDKIADKIAVLKERYPAGSELPDTLGKLKRDNQDLKISAIDQAIRSKLGRDPMEYLREQGLLAVEKKPKERPRTEYQDGQKGFSFLGKSFVTTLLGPSQEDRVMQIVMERGGRMQSAVSRHTAYLITIPGVPQGTVKYERALQLIQKGFPIQIMTYKEFLSKTKEFDASPENQTQGFLIEGGILQKYRGNERHIQIPDGITSIAANAFYGNASIESVSFPNGLLSIERHAFENCTNLSSISLPETLNTIHDHAFDDCTSLKELHIPDSVTTIQSYAFKNCNQLTEVTIPPTVKNIGKGVFRSCSNLKEIHFPDNMTEIPEGIVSGCSQIQNILLPETLNIIYARAFDGCVSLEKIHIPDSVTTIQIHAFRNCARLTEVTIPPTVKNIGKEAFSSCSNLKEIHFPDYMTEIPEGIVSGCSQIQNLLLPKTIKKIGDYAFAETNLESIILPPALEEIGAGAFCWCKLREIVFPESIKTIGSAAFVGCKFTKVTIPPTVKNIGKEVFASCSKLKEIHFPDNMTEIPEGIVLGCDRLRNILLPKAIKKIGDYAFSDTHLKSIILPTTVEEIGAHAFEDCTELNEVCLPEGLERIGDYAFANCGELTEESFTVVNGD